MNESDDGLFSLDHALMAETFYQTEGVFFKPLFEFEEKIASLASFYGFIRKEKAHSV